VTVTIFRVGAFDNLILIVSGVLLERGSIWNHPHLGLPTHLDVLTRNPQAQKSASCVLTQDTVSLFCLLRLSRGRFRSHRLLSRFPAALLCSAYRGSCEDFPPRCRAARIAALAKTSASSQRRRLPWGRRAFFSFSDVCYGYRILNLASRKDSNGHSAGTRRCRRSCRAGRRR
jgi:hypothetical protein